MNLLSCVHDSRKDNYVLYYSSLLVFAIIAIIPINLHLTRFSFPITAILFTIGFFSLFMVARNEKVGFGLLKFLRIEARQKKSMRSWQHVSMYANSAMSTKTQYAPNPIEELEEPILLLQNFIKELSRRHEERMDWTTLDSFRILNERIEQLVVRNK